MGWSVVSLEKDVVVDMDLVLSLLRGDGVVLDLGFLFSCLFGRSSVEEVAGLEIELDSLHFELWEMNWIWVDTTLQVENVRLVSPSCVESGEHSTVRYHGVWYS